MNLFSPPLRHKRLFSWRGVALRRCHWSKVAAGSRWPLFLDSTETRGNNLLVLNYRQNSEFENKFQKSHNINLCSCFHFIQQVLSPFLFLLKNKHCFDKISSHRDSEISVHSPLSLFQKEFSKQKKALEIVCWMSQGYFIHIRKWAASSQSKMYLCFNRIIIQCYLHFFFFFSPYVLMMICVSFMQFQQSLLCLLPFPAIENHVSWFHGWTNQPTQGLLHIGGKSSFWNPSSHCFSCNQTDFYRKDCSWGNKWEITVQQPENSWKDG